MSFFEEQPHPIRKRMKATRRKQGVTEAEIAAYRGISPGSVHDNEMRPGKPRDALIRDYSQYLGEPEKYFRTGRRK